MKKFLSLLAVFCLVLSLAVPALAVDNEPLETAVKPHVSANGVIVPFTTYTKTYAFMFYGEDGYVHLISSLYSPAEFVDPNIIMVRSGSTFSEGVLHAYVRNDVWMVVANGGNLDSYEVAAHRVFWSNHDIEYSDGSAIWLEGSDLEPLCDGSSCSVADVDVNGICNTCGMALMRMVAGPSGWPSNLPAPPGDYASYTVLTDANGTWLYMVTDEEPKLNITEPDANGKRTLHFTIEGAYPSTNIQRYRLSGDEWAYNSVGSLRSFSFDESLTFDYSTVDVYDMTGQPFFPEPLWVVIPQVTQGETPALLNNLGGVMMTLVVCGVGCLALLIGLTLFGKRSLISLR